MQAAAFQPLVSVTSVGELKAIAAGGSWAQGKMDRMKDLLDRLVQVSISETEVLDAYVVAVNSRSPGLTIPQNDLWIAACAMATGSCLLTTDRHFEYLAEQGIIRRGWIDPGVGRERPQGESRIRQLIHHLPLGLDNR